MTTDTIIPRVCLVCEHFTLDMGSCGFSDATPSEPATIDCAKEGEKGCPWELGGYDYDGLLRRQQLRSLAEQCEHFEVAAALRAEGDPQR